MGTRGRRALGAQVTLAMSFIGGTPPLSTGGLAARHEPVETSAPRPGTRGFFSGEISALGQQGRHDARSASRLDGFPREQRQRESADDDLLELRDG